jgi:hypothetical protein
VRDRKPAFGVVKEEAFNDEEAEMATDLWTYRDQALGGLDLTGYEVEATDGTIGKIDMATHDVGASYIVVDTGVWNPHGQRVVLPAATIERVGAARVFLNRSQKEILDAPPFDGKGGFEGRERAMLDSYYRARFLGQEPWEAEDDVPPARSREELYEEAKTLGVEGRSNMTKEQLRRAVDDARTKR